MEGYSGGVTGIALHNSRHTMLWKAKGPLRGPLYFRITAPCTDQDIAFMPAAKRLFCRETVFLCTMRLSAIESMRLCDI
jgi:hypothetical protein